MAYPKTIPKLIEVKDSSNVQGIAYDPISRDLFVSYLPTATDKLGPLYRYKDVPVGTWRRFYKTASKGMFIWTHIRGKFAYAKWTGTGWKKEMALKRASAAVKKRKAQRK